jgi:hypothetical protein
MEDRYGHQLIEMNTIMARGRGTTQALKKQAEETACACMPRLSMDLLDPSITYTSHDSSSFVDRSILF